MTIIEDFEKALESGDRASIEGVAVRLVRSGVDTAKYVLQVVASLRHNLRVTRKERDDALDALEAMVRRYCDRPDPKDEQEVTPGGVLVTPSGEEEAHNAITLLWHHGRADYEDPENAIWRLRPVGGEDA
ncbi:MAG: hypothetical protein D6698_16625 [Gammaproteobacteria bacterium]|nr:MAG: hypothetical protein D6698_16625 [Gammaproteobacteria bacterium]